ncbi:unnamed protein product [Camellia sinensis]
MLGVPLHHQHSQPFVGHGRPDYDHSSRSFKGLSGPLPSDVAMEMNNVLNNLTGTKESIKGAKIWFMQRSPFAPALAEALRDGVYLQRRINPHELDREGKCKVSDVETIQELIEKGNATRSAGTTGANEESSRSHASLQLAIQRSADGSESKPPRVVGKLSFIDLAGSE